MNDEIANAKKRETDRLARELLSTKPASTQKDAQRVVGLLPPNARLVVAGGAGTGKTSLSKAVARLAGLPVFDLDEAIEGGYTRNEKEYRRRFVNALVKVFQQLPVRTGWVVEHVEACNDDLVKSFHPTHALLVERGVMSLINTAEARTIASGGSGLARHMRALETAVQAKKQFGELKGDDVGRGRGWTLKALG